ncbi:hypothetical protein B0A55_02156 [Friedmanniomyces simplex]|uniref:5-formyltetrahydrofolate cyclo-ligase n=1 Tax=Friedmanniomyces simplex TaxID=329884 RepID=A0A4U0Y2H6_9PEZI|nr:hypothetical protein B0A55_02156 [Friedmanniomyces simplex]
MSTAVRETKKALRKDIKDRLSTLSAVEVGAQSNIAQLLILSLPQYKHAGKLGIYMSMPTGEAQTELLVRDALHSGKRVYVPCIHSVPKPGMKSGTGKVMDMLRLSSIEEYGGLERDSWGIPHLPHDSLEGRENAIGGSGTSPDTEVAHDGDGGLDLIVVPGVAFDAEMNRMGHGAGFYDRFLTRFCEGEKRRRPFLVGLCLAEQILPKGQIMMQEWDWKVDAIAVGDGRLLASAEGA